MDSTTSTFTEGQAVETVGLRRGYNGLRATVVWQEPGRSLVSLNFHDGRGLRFVNAEHLRLV